MEKQDDGSWACNDFWSKGLTGENAYSDENNLWVDLVNELNEKGEFTIPGQYLQDDRAVTAVGTNADDLSADDSDTVGVNAAVTAITGIAGDDFEIGLSDISSDNKVTITGTTNATTGGETVTLTVDGKEIGTATVNADGTFSAEVNVGDLTNVSDADRKVTASIDGGAAKKEYTVAENDVSGDNKPDDPEKAAAYDRLFFNARNGDTEPGYYTGTSLDDVVVLQPTKGNISTTHGVQRAGSVIDTGDGNDTVSVVNGDGNPGIFGFAKLGDNTGTDAIVINTGSGNDTLRADGTMPSGTSSTKGTSLSNVHVDMGAGDDVVTIKGPIGYDLVKDTYVDGGDGIDTLNIIGSGVTQHLAMYDLQQGKFTNANMLKGFEVIDLGDNGNKLDGVTWTAVQNNNAEQALRILGGGDDQVDLDGAWSQTGSSDGFDIYRHESNTAGNDHLDIWIQQGIQII